MPKMSLQNGTSFYLMAGFYLDRRLRHGLPVQTSTVYRCDESAFYLVGVFVLALIALLVFVLCSRLTTARAQASSQTQTCTRRRIHNLIIHRHANEGVYNTRLEEVARQAERAEERLKLFPASEQAASKVSAHVQDSFSDEEKVFADLQLKYNRAVVEARNRELEVVQMEEERGAARKETFKLRLQLQAMRDMMNQSVRDVMSQSLVMENSKMGPLQEVGAGGQLDAAQHWLFAFPEVNSCFYLALRLWA